MSTQTHYINGVKVAPPKNSEEVTIEINRKPDGMNSTVGIDSFEWVDYEAALLRSILDNGVTGGIGILEGVPHNIIVQEGTTVLTLLNGYIDLTNATFDRNLVTANSYQVAEIDWLNQVADSFSFEYLYSEGYITDDDFVFIPYIISTVPDYQATFITSLTFVFIIQELQKVIKNIAAFTFESASIIDTLGGIIRLIFEITYAVLLFITLIELILDVISLVIQPVKYKAAMKLNRLIETACDYLGIGYESNLLQSGNYADIVIAPESFDLPQDPNDSRIKGFLTADKTKQKGYYNGTFGDLLRAIKTTYNLRFVPNGQKLIIEPMNQRINTANVVIPPVDQQAFKTNASELYGNLNYSFSYDINDRNTIDNWEGTNVDVNLDYVTLNNPRLRLLKNGKVIQSPFARAIRKTTLTEPEIAVDTFLTLVSPLTSSIVNSYNSIGSIISQGMAELQKITGVLKPLGVNIPTNLPPVPTSLSDPNLANLIDNRLGMMLLENDQFTVPKILLLKLGETNAKNKIPTNNATFINARFIYTAHYADDNDQCYIRQLENIELNLSDVINIINDGAVRLNNGNILEIDTCTWNQSTRLAEIEGREYRIYTNNLKTTINEPTNRS